jgi:hypothetical protein
MLLAPYSVPSLYNLRAYVIIPKDGAESPPSFLADYIG